MHMRALTSPRPHGFRFVFVQEMLLISFLVESSRRMWALRNAKSGVRVACMLDLMAVLYRSVH